MPLYVGDLTVTYIEWHTRVYQISY